VSLTSYIRGSTSFTVIIAPIYKLLKANSSLGMVGVASIVGVLLLALALFSASTLPETYGKDLNYIE
jgi:putative MFS transporter